MSFDVKNRVALVTGANRGIGRAIVEEAIRRGASKVYAAVRDPRSADPLVQAYGSQVVPIRVDLEDPSSIESAAKVASDVQLVINNAGVLKNATPLSKDAIESLQYEFNVNVFGFLMIAQAFAPVLNSNGGGAFVQLNSVVSIKSFSDFATYSASKAASYSLTQALRETLASQNTQVVSVHPGPIATDMAHAAGLSEIAEPPSVVATAIFEALMNGAFHVWPDTMAKQFGEAYATYAKTMVEPQLNEDHA